MARYLFVFRIAARQQWAYRAELGLRAISIMLFVGIFMALWVTAFRVSGQGTLGGYSLAQMVWYLAMAETVTLSTSRVFTEISEAVKAGDLAYTLTRPLSYPFYQVANSLGNSAPRFLLNLGTAVLVVLVGIGQFAGSPAGLVAFLVMAWLALLLDALIAVLIGLAAFWLEEVTPVFWIYQKLVFTLGGLFLPLDFFPPWLQRLSRWLPFQAVTYAPAQAFVAFTPETVLRNLAVQVAYIAVCWLAVMLVWRAARRRLVINGG